MWKLPPVALPWLVAAAFAAGSVTAGSTAWWIRGKDVAAAEARGRAEVADLRAAQEGARADAEAGARGKLTQDMERISNALEARQKEMERVAADLARRNRDPQYIRVCPPDPGPVPGAGGAGGPEAADPGPAAPGVVHGADGGLVGTLVDVRPPRELAARADQVSADLRACLEAWPQ